MAAVPSARASAMEILRRAFKSREIRGVELLLLGKIGKGDEAFVVFAVKRWRLISR